MAAVDLVVVLCAAALRTVVCRHKPLAFHALAAWAFVVLAAYAANEFGERRLVIVGIALAVLVSVLALSRVPRAARTLWAGIRAQSRDVWLVLAALGLQVTLYAAPLTVLPTHTLITGNFICNDSVAHAVLMRGFDFVHGAFGHWAYLGYYPDGIHAVVYGLSRFFTHADVPYFLLPAAIWSASFLALAILMLLAEEGQPLSVTSVLVAASPAAAFLLGTSVYLYFIGHIGVLPFIAGSVVIVSTWTPADLHGRGLILALAPLGAALATYGLLSLSLIGFAVLLRIGLELRVPRQAVTLAREFARACANRDALIGLVLVLAMLAPVARQLLAGSAFFASQVSTVGNLPGGFLNPLHVTGFWKGGAEYRSPLTGPDSPAGMILAAIFGLQAVLIARAGLRRTGALTLVTFATPVVASALFIRSPYVNFKYLCLLTAVWVPLAALGLARLMSRLAAGNPLPGMAAVAALLLVMVVNPMRSFQLLPALPEHWFQTIAAVRAQHLAKGPVLILSLEDWFQYYRDTDDVVPLTTYFRQPYTGQVMQEVLVDDGFPKDVRAFLDRSLPGAAARLDTCPSESMAGRFHLYQFTCLAGAR